MHLKPTATKLPYDLSLFVRKKKLARLLPCLILFLLFSTILILWGEKIFPIENPIARFSCCFLVLILPFLITGVPHKLIDRTYRGKILRVDIFTTVDNSSGAKPTREHLYSKNTIRLLLETEDGKQIYREVYSGRSKLQQHLQTFVVGDSVFHLHGTHTVVILPQPNDTALDCAVCGTTNSTTDAVCRACGHTLIK